MSSYCMHPLHSCTEVHLPTVNPHTFTTHHRHVLGLDSNKKHISVPGHLQLMGSSGPLAVCHSSMLAKQCANAPQSRESSKLVLFATCRTPSGVCYQHAPGWVSYRRPLQFLDRHGQTDCTCLHASYLDVCIEWSAPKALEHLLAHAAGVGAADLVRCEQPFGNEAPSQGLGHLAATKEANAFVQHGV